MGRLVEVGREGERGVELQGEEILEENSAGEVEQNAEGDAGGAGAGGGGTAVGFVEGSRRWARGGG